MQDPVRDANYWRNRYRTRAKAKEELVFGKPKVDLLKVANSMSRLAERGERWRRTEPDEDSSQG